MNDEDRRYLKSIKKISPSLEVFGNMVRILANVQEKTDRLLNVSLLETSKVI